tara:strand:+ start:9112 stop:9762 length:651 start_codon:yes stop_codon:yes gene_type:complete
MSFTYAQLKQAVQDYTENDETTFVTNLPIFIRNTEERILKTIQLNFFRKNVSATFTQSDQYLAAPNDFLAPFSLSYTDGSGNKEFLLFKDVNFIQEFNPKSTTEGSPRYYAVFDISNFIISPTPNSSYVAELHYFYRPTSLTSGADSGTTWLSENASICMLYGSLIEAYTFMKGEPDLIQNYTQRFIEAAGGLKLLGEAKETTQEYSAGRVVIPKQ